MHKRTTDSILSVGFTLPAVILFTVFFMFPCLNSFYYSFSDWNGLSQDISFIGIANFIEMLHDQRVIVSIGNTAYYAIINTLAINFISLLLGMVLSSKIRITNFLRIVFYIPALLSGIIVAFSFSYIFDPNIGILNGLLDTLGLSFLKQNWLGNADLAMNSILSVSLWQWMGYHAIIYLANLQSIPGDYYEAADIDGARFWHKFRYITWPLVAPALTINVTLLTIGSLKVFDTIFAMTNGGPGYATETIALSIYFQSFRENRMGYGSALSVVLTIVILVISFTLNKYLRSREVVYQ